MKKFYSFLALMILGSGVVSAQTFPCGEADLSICPCPTDGVLIADSEPCTFTTAEQQVYLLVDVNDASVDGDDDSDAIVAVSTDGTFEHVATGDYVAYQLVYSNEDATSAEMLTEVGDAIADVQAQFSTGLTASTLATVNADDCNCDTYTLGNFVWWDQNLDGVYDAGEPGIPFVTVNLYDSDPGAGKMASNAIIATTTTDADGYYSFGELNDGDYWIEVATPEGYFATGAGAELNDDNNFNNYPSNTVAGPFTLSAQENVIVTIDAGFAFDEAVCDDFSADVAILSQGYASDSYMVIVTVNFTGENGGFIVESPTGFNGTVTGSFSDGPFPNGSGFEYTIYSADIPGCSETLSASSVDLDVTAIELARFEATAEEAGNNITWTTASETDNDYFTVEYSKDGVNFEPIHNENGSGNTSTGTTYSYLDTDYATAVSYYRLSATDFNGVTKYASDVVRVERAISELTFTDVFPVPATESINVEFLAATATLANVDIFDITGKLVTSTSISTVTGANAQNFDISNLNTGTYFIMITAGNEQITAKFIKN